MSQSFWYEHHFRSSNSGRQNGIYHSKRPSIWFHFADYPCNSPINYLHLFRHEACRQFFIFIFIFVNLSICAHCSEMCTCMHPKREDALFDAHLKFSFRSELIIGQYTHNLFMGAKMTMEIYCMTNQPSENFAASTIQVL